MRTDKPQSLLVFSDDWGRHPSSCQHLIRQLLPEFPVLWVNTIGTRAPRLDWNTVKRVAEKLRQWRPATSQAQTENSPSGDVRPSSLQVVNPRMWPWFRRSVDRRINAALLERQLKPLMERLPQPVTAITTLPITADLPGRLPVSRWLYYCVDDFAAWPGLDGDTLRRMDDDMIDRADDLVAVSEHLQQQIARRHREASLLTHGVSLDHWAPESRPLLRTAVPDGPVAVFWGVVDRRLDTAMLTALSETFAHAMPEAHILLAGPRQDPDPDILRLPNVVTTGPVPFDELPALAARADVLIMPYADLPVTRAMQPLKMKEYLATGRPVVVSQLPAVAAWQDAMDVCSSPGQFVRSVQTAMRDGLSDEHRAARQRLQQESWTSKARQLRAVITSSSCGQPTPVLT